jgi:hypothetical protein
MKITEEAKIILLDAISTHKADCLLVSQQTTCCSTSLNFTLANLNDGEVAEMIDGVPVFMESKIKVLIEKVSIHAENNQLFVKDENAKACDC